LLKAYLPFSHELTLSRFALDESTPGDREHKEHIYQQCAQKEMEARKPIDEAEKLISKYRYAKARLLYLEKREEWLAKESQNITIPLISQFRPFHWEEDAGGGQSCNSFLPWWERTRLNRKDLTAALIFGIRISLFVGVASMFLSLIIGVPLGLFAGYFAGKTDMIVLRFIEIWEAMPPLFTLLLISAIMHNKSLALTILILGLFGWTSFARYMRAEVLRERTLPYVMASKSLGFHHKRIMFSHILPNAMSPILALLPFAMMSAITSEAALSFLGLGEEGSTSWGVLMSEARSVFPSESYLLWPPALLLTCLLVAIALVGDGLRDALDPKTQN
jgi:peptide/nickel transport system permease protein